jgi:hypothetical protein
VTVGYDFSRATKPPYDGAEESYMSGALLCLRLLLVLGVIGAATYYNVTFGTYVDPAAAPVADTAPAPAPAVAVIIPKSHHRAPQSALAPIMPKPDRRPAPSAVAANAPEPGHLPGALSESAIIFAGLPQQPVDPPPTALSDWTGAPVIPELPVDQETSTAPAKAVARPIVPPAPLTALALPDTLPTGSALHLRIVYQPSDPAEAPRLEALTARLRSQNSEIASATTSAGRASHASVVYFFANDRAGASRIAASLARITRRAEPVSLVHANPLPRPGTVEIRLPSAVEKDLNDEGY